MADPTPAQVRSFIAAGLPCQWLDVQGDGRHFFATIVSAEFEGLSPVKRHQR
jgi:acid stress-induced BolA-like protein IbaG/YrbA